MTTKFVLSIGMILVALCGASLSRAHADGCDTKNLVAGNGGGVNGPDTCGTSTPLEFDGDIDYERPNEVTQACGTQFAKKLILLAYRSVAEEAKITVTSSSDDETFEIAWRSADYSVQLLQFKGNQFTVSEATLFRFPSRYYAKVRTVANLKTVDLKAFSIPSFSYDSEKVDFVYGAFGEEKSHRTVVRNLRLLHANDYGKHLRFRNTLTQQDLDYEIDFTEFQKCLADGFKR